MSIAGSTARSRETKANPATAHPGAAAGEDHRDRVIDEEPHNPAEHHDHQQHIGESMNVPSESKASMHRDDDESQQSEVHMGTRPALKRAQVGRVPALPDAQEHEHQNRDQSDPTVNETPDSAPRGSHGAGIIEIADEERHGSYQPAPQITLVSVCK